MDVYLQKSKIIRSIQSWKIPLINTYRELTPSILIILFALFVLRAGSMTFFFFPLILSKNHGLSVETIGTLLTFYGFGKLIGPLVGSYKVTHEHYISRIMFSLFISGISLLCLGLCLNDYHNIPPSLTFLLIGIAGIGLESQRPLVSAFLIGEGNRAEIPPLKIVSLERQVINAGSFVAPVIGAFFSDSTIQILTAIDAFACLISFSIILKYFSLKLSISGLHNYKFNFKQLEKILSAFFSKIDNTFRNLNQLSTLNILNVDLKKMLVFIPPFLASLLYFQLFSTLPLLLEKIWKIEASTFGYMMTINGALVLLTEVYFLHLLRNLSLKKWRFVSSLGLLLLALPIFLIAMFSSYSYLYYPLFCGSFILFTLGEILCFPGFKLMILKSTNQNSNAQNLSYLQVSIALGAIMAPLIGTKILFQLGMVGLSYFFITLSGLAIVLNLLIK